MKQPTILITLGAILSSGCSPAPSSPTPASAVVVRSAEGDASARTIKTDRLRLRRVGGGDIATGLQTGQRVAVPVNVPLDVWAEITRSESDRARLVVDWGNGNADFMGCGPCRLENTYTQTGSHTLTVKVIDLNAPSGSEVIAQAIVTVDVAEPPPACDPVINNFDSLPDHTPLPVTVPGLTIVGDGTFVVGGPGFEPFLVNTVLVSNTLTSTIELQFPVPKTTLSFSGLVALPGEWIAYQAFSSDGSLVASGNAAPPQYSFFTGGTLVVTGPPFVRVVLTSNSSLGFVLDLVEARCN